MSWSIRSRRDPSRWLECSDGIEFTADPETVSILGDIAEYRFMLTPTGLEVRGIRTPSELYAAAVHVIPAAEWSGDLPAYPDIGSTPALLVY